MAVRASAPVRIGANLAGLVIFVACVFPVYWMVNTSLLPRREINAPDPTWLPFGGSFDNYRRVLTRRPVLRRALDEPRCDRRDGRPSR